MGKQKLFWRTDYQIRASSLRVVGADGKLIGEMSSDEEAKAAIEKINGSPLKDRNINVNEAKPMTPR